MEQRSINAEEAKRIIDFAQKFSISLNANRQKDFQKMKEIYNLSLDLQELLRESDSWYEKISEQTGKKICKYSLSSFPVKPKISDLKKWYQNEICCVIDYNISALTTWKNLMQK